MIEGARGEVQSPPMNAAKEEVMHLLDLLPEDASLDDIQYHIYVRQKIDHGLEDVEAGRTLSGEEFDQRLGEWPGTQNGRRRGPPDWRAAAHSIPRQSPLYVT